MDDRIKDSYDYISDAVRAYWEKHYTQDVVAFFWQKYSYESDDEWEWYEEVCFCKSPDDYDTVEFLSDFCEGQTCVKNITIVPLSEVIGYYANAKLDNGIKKGGEKNG